MIQGFASRTRIVGIFLALGLASSAYAQSGTSRLHFEVRRQGAPSSTWTTDLTVAPGTIVEFRALVTYTGTLPVVGLALANFQPTVSHWDPSTDTLRNFRRSGFGTSPTSPFGPQSGSVIADSGEYGRVYPYGSPGIGAPNPLRGHTNNVSGVRYLRIAQNNTTNWAGAGPTTGTAGSNNFNGAGGVNCGQAAPRFFGLLNTEFVQQTVDVEIARFAIRVDGTTMREMRVSAPAESIPITPFPSGERGFGWYSTLESSSSFEVRGPVTIESAIIRVPTPGALALLGFGGVIAARRRR